MKTPKDNFAALLFLMCVVAVAKTNAPPQKRSVWGHVALFSLLVAVLLNSCTPAQADPPMDDISARCAAEPQGRILITAAFHTPSVGSFVYGACVRFDGGIYFNFGPVKDQRTATGVLK